MVAHLDKYTIKRADDVPSHLKEVTLHRQETGGLLGALQLAVGLQEQGLHWLEVTIVADNNTLVITVELHKLVIVVAIMHLFTRKLT